MRQRGIDSQNRAVAPRAGIVLAVAPTERSRLCLKVMRKAQVFALAIAIGNVSAVA